MNNHNPSRTNMHMTKNITLALLAGVLANGPITAAEPLPYGHPDFVPTPERPIGFQGDGNGHFPGATLVSEFWDGRPIWGEVELRDEKQGKSPALVYADQVPKNILWKTELPGWTYAKPIPVKGRLYGIAEPDWVWCADQATGKILWQERLTLASVEPDLAGKPDEQRKRQEIYDIGRAVHFIEIPFRGITSQQDPFVAQAITAMQKMKARMLELDPDPKLQAAFDEEIACIICFRDEGREGMKAKYGQGRNNGVGIGAEPSGAVPNFIVRKYKVALKPLWWGYCPGAVSVPASDGERIFVCMGQGQVAAYDLDGKRLWVKRHRAAQQGRVEHWPSPLVVNDLVLIRQALNPNGKEPGGLVAYRRTTGEQVWERYFNAPGGHGSYQSPTHLRNPGPDGKGLDLVVSWSDMVVRAADGSVVAEKLTVPFFKCMIQGQGLARVGRKDAFVAGNAGDTGSEDGRFKISWEGNTPRTVFEFHFDTPENGPNMGRGHLRAALRLEPGPVLLADAPVLINGSRTWDWDTGRVLGALSNKNPAAIYGALTGIGGNQCVIGRTVLSSNMGHPAGRQRKDLSTALPQPLLDVSDPRHPRYRSLWNLVGGSEYPTDCIFQTWLPGVDIAQYWLVGGFTGLPTWLCGGQCSPLAQGEKTFFQTYKYLYAIGPAVKGTATDDPKVVASIRRETDAAKLEGYLQHASAQYRFEAVQRVTSPNQTVRKLAVEDPYEEIRAAAIQALERATPGDGQALLTRELEAFANRKYGWLTFDEAFDQTRLAETCRRLGDRADASLAEVLEKTPAKSRLLALAEYADLCGPRLEKACLAIITAKPDPKTKSDPSESLWAVSVLARGGKAVANAEAIVATLEANLPAWNDGGPNSIQPDAWKPFDDCLALPACRPRLIALLGVIIAQDKPDASRFSCALRRIEALGKEAVSLKPRLEARKGWKEMEPWINRILAGMGAK